MTGKVSDATPSCDRSASYQALIEYAPMPMAMVEGASQVVRHANPAFCRLMDRSRKELVGKPFRELLPEKDESVTVLSRVFRGGKPESHTQQQGQSKSHPVFWSYVMWPVMADKRPAGVMIHVTETAHFHENTVAMNEALILGSVRQHELAASAEALNVQAREADVRKNHFLATLAHELRNPLTPICLMLDVMKRTDGKSDKITSGLAMIDRQVRQMTRLIDDLLDVSRITRDRLILQQEDIELASVIRDVADTYRPVCESAQLELSVTLPPEPVYLHADPVRLTQVLSNLLQNACKFTKPGGQVSLHVERQGDEVVIVVRDSGVGIPADMLAKIFDLFVQSDTTLEMAQGGLGIGLPLVRRLVQLHGGSVHAFSAGRDKGSQIVVRLPLIEKPKALPPAAPAANGPTAQPARRFLVVDDNQDAANALSTLLKLSGNETQIAFDGMEAVKAAEKFRPDVVLMDIGMPKLDGYGAARRIREQPWGKAMTLVAVTGWGHEEDRRKSAAAGFDGHVVKPVVYDALTTTLAGLRK